MQPTRLVLTCEHASRSILPSLKNLFLQSRDIVTSHRGYDIGALSYAKTLASLFRSPVYSAKVSRLIIDLNRSLHHRNVFPEYTLCLSKARKQDLIERYWLPFRESVFSEVARACSEQKCVLHLSCHTFTPLFHGTPRHCDMGLLFDPRRSEEKQVAYQIYDQLTRETALRVRMNYPYKGRADGHTTSLRRQFGSGQYMGIEIEVNQALIGTAYWKYVGFPSLVRAIQSVLRE